MRKERNFNEINDIVDPRLMIKEYSRSSADQDLPLPNEMRPIHVLYDTMIYLIDEIIAKIANEDENPSENGEFSLCDWYDFVWNRTRSIRKDIIQQRLLLNDMNETSSSQNQFHDNEFLNNGLGGVLIIEQHARFHILCAHRLCEQSAQVFDFKINEENLKNCFQSLRQYYEKTSHSKNENRLRPSPNESEFRSYIILLNLRESNIGMELKRWPSHLRHSKHVSFALKIYNAYNSKNYVKFFRLVRSNQCEYLQACLLHRYFYNVRSTAFETIFLAFKENNLRKYPLSKLVDNLGFDDINEANNYCNAFGLDIVDENVVMKSTMNNNIFSLSKQDEDRLKAHRSFQIVENKFIEKLRESNYTLSNEQLLGEIISGLRINFNKNPSRFGINSYHELTSSFDDEGYFTSDEIEKLAEHARQKIAFFQSQTIVSSGISSSANLIPKFHKNKNIIETSGLHLKSITTNKPVSSKIASNLIRKAQLNKSVNKHSPGVLANNENPLLTQQTIKDRRKSSSSNSSNETVKSQKNKKVTAAAKQTMQPSEQPSAVFNPFKLNNNAGSSASLFGQKMNTAQQENQQSLFKIQNPQQQQQQTTLFGKPTAQSTSLTSKLKPSTFSVSQPTFSGFNQSQESTTTAPGTFGRTSLFGQNNFVKPTGFQSETTKSSVNLFENLIKKQESQAQLLPNQQVQQQLDQKDAEAKINQKADSFFQSIYLELIKDICQEFLYKEKNIPQFLLDDLIELGVKDFSRNISYETIDELKREREQLYQLELMRQQQANEAQIKNQMINSICEEFILDMTNKIVKENCIDYLKMMRDYENIVFDDIICNVFQKEFDIIIQQIARELKNEILFNRLAENVYLNYSENPLEDASFETSNESDDLTSSDLVNPTSIFMNDLRSFLHECVYEFTRLNLNINRELYYELNQALMFNQQVYLFRKWRLKLSLKLLNKAHRRTSFNMKNQQQQLPQSIDILPKNILKESSPYNQQLHLITFLSSYGEYLLQNLSKLQKIISFLVTNSDYSFSNQTFNSNQKYLESDSNNIYNSILHCEQYQMYLTWNINLNYKNYLNELILDNYFNIIHNRDDCLILPIPKYDQDYIQNNELLIKTIVAIEPLSNSSNLDCDDEAIKRWLMNKFFHFDSKKTYSYETKHIENACVNLLKSDKYGIKFCIKYQSSIMNQNEYESKLKSRSLFGSCSMVYVFMPHDPNKISFQHYLNENRENFHKILKLFNENIELNEEVINSYEYMFISYLDDHEKTQLAINFILASNKTNYCYCLLEGDVVKDDGTFQQTYKYFLHKICYRLSLRAVESKLDNIYSISSIIEKTLMKFFDFLSNHQITRSSIHLPLECVINEFNSRLDKLISMLTRPDYKRISWPIPEFIDCQDLIKSDINFKTLKYWNSNECFDDALGNQLRNLVYLNDLDNEEWRSKEQNELVLFEEVETLIFNYSNSLLMNKEKMRKFPPQSECINTIFQLENSIKMELEKMKKLHCDKSNYISIHKIEWHKLLDPIVEYLLTNGYLTFQNSENKIYLSQFFIYVNLSELNSYDWINNCEEKQQDPNSCYLLKKYSRNEEKCKYNNLKRRYTDDSLYVWDASAREEKDVEQEQVEQTPDKEDLKDKSNVFYKYKRLESPQKAMPLINLNENKKEMLEFDLKLNKFFEFLHSEKENNFKFDNQLIKLKSNDVNSQSNTAVAANIDNDKKLQVTGTEPSTEESNLLTKNLDTFFNMLKEEKIKNEQFNSKLNQILD